MQTTYLTDKSRQQILPKNKFKQKYLIKKNKLKTKLNKQQI